MRTRQDLMLLRMAWVFDLNFRPTLAAIHQREILPALERRLPASDQVRSLCASVRRYVERRLFEDQSPPRRPVL